MLRTTRWRLHRDTPDTRGLFPSLNSLNHLTGIEINGNRMSRLLKVEKAASTYYVKIYASRDRWLRSIAVR